MTGIEVGGSLGHDNSGGGLLDSPKEELSYLLIVTDLRIFQIRSACN